MRKPAFHDRADAGRALAGRLSAYASDPDVTVLALPRGGVPVAAEVARALRAPLDVFVVRKLGVPGNEELAMGAIASGGIRTLNADLVDALRIPPHAIDAVAAREQRELERRERLYRGGRAPADLRGRTVILVDDGLATGATMLAAIEAVRLRRPAHLVVAVPTASRETLARLKREADAVVCIDSPEPFRFVGASYADFAQTSDEEVRRLLGDGGAAAKPEGDADDPVPADDPALVAALRQEAIRLTGGPRDYDALMELIGEARLALLGEATHGTQDFYRERAEITKRLIREKGFGAVAIEADWPDAWRVNRYVRGESEDLDAVEALSGFRRFPTWLWRNTEMVAFVEWLRRHNATQPEEGRVGLYGIDLYSLHASMKAVVTTLAAVDPAAAAQARARYACFDRFGEDSQVYGFMTGLKLAPSCEAEVVAQLAALQRRAADSLARTGSADRDELFSAEQNASVVRTAEEYYRTMFLREVSSWNLRDTHMADCIGALIAHLGRSGRAAKVAIWAHNSHLGDARATQMGARGEINLGQLLRERHGRAVVRIGFTTYSGTVAAASDWGAPVERKRVRPALPGSHEALFHALGLGRFCLIPAPGTRAAAALHEGRLQRAIGVIYRPETERQSHYVEARLPEQFEAVLHLDETRAIEPLETGVAWEAGEVPETFPAGL
ncbi:hypothetical protein DA075_20815 [Methylobacterium currus]|uniref:Phosphoribosyltransferase domain-containing protein n=1 Tax=Methylobacterium currus TaxID=2051553 RepID=A0A2R4WNC9_9HYPH|nr:erythromycin esterase family protein [Methylobacterium currus]AWB23042.1 hypothetical protein DA075_20815 [Methylobacterium currus]UHC17068.1 erythromycin esterase family protein [Methylobacterium currus]